MSSKDPAQSERNELSMSELSEMFPDERSAQKWFEDLRWSEGRFCGHCGGTRTNTVTRQRPMPYWCSNCRKYFSIKTGTPMQASNIPLRKWAFAMHRMTSHRKGITSVQLHRDLDITQKSAWFMIKRIRSAWNREDEESAENLE